VTKCFVSAKKDGKCQVFDVGAVKQKWKSGFWEFVLLFVTRNGALSSLLWTRPRWMKNSRGEALNSES
jgi:hypothetical protein